MAYGPIGHLGFVKLISIKKKKLNLSNMYGPIALVNELKMEDEYQFYVLLND